MLINNVNISIATLPIDRFESGGSAISHDGSVVVVIGWSDVVPRRAYVSNNRGIDTAHVSLFACCSHNQ